MKPIYFPATIHKMAFYYSATLEIETTEKIMKKVYEVYAARESAECNGKTFLLSAPIEVIADIFNLRPEGRKRILRECTDHSGVCYLHFNGKSFIGQNYVAVGLSRLVVT